MAATETGARTFHNFIDGATVAAGATTDVVNPADGRVMAHAPDSTAEDVERAVTAARAAFGGWSGLTPAQRGEALLKLADAIEEHGDELAELEARNAGKPLTRQARRRDPHMRRQRALLRRRRAHAGGQGRGRVPARAHVVGCGARRSASSARSRRGTTR